MSCSHYSFLRQFARVRMCSTLTADCQSQKLILSLPRQAIAAHPALVSAAPAPEKLAPEEFPADIEDEANSYYQQIYESEQLTIQQVGSWHAATLPVLTYTSH